MKRLWRKLFPAPDRCDICGSVAYRLKWGGYLHITRNGTHYVHAMHYIRYVDWSLYKGL